MSFRIRGQEVQLRIQVDGQDQQGSWVKVKDFTATARGELVEENYLGETTTDLDQRHDGFDLAFSVDLEDRNTIDFLSDHVAREEFHVAPPDITITAIYAFRNGNAPIAVSYSDCVLRVDEESYGSRTEYVSVSFSGKAKTRSVINL